VIFIFGGSQGAIAINSLVLSALPFLMDLKGRLKIVHQTGERDYLRVLEGYQKLEFQFLVERFIDDMPSIYRQSSLLISRAGSSTLSEIAAVGRASILIPLPTAADNHQEVNARVFAENHAAELLVQATATGEGLARLIREFVSHPEKISVMEKKVREYDKPQAAERIVAALMK
jgi:UDP-N-acetylglucosamine--N-acetylmuramyl-(pentapeptide) pyrophosphoryl-undecaprenol N-acetylglucosamine transferase